MKDSLKKKFSKFLSESPSGLLRKIFSAGMIILFLLTVFVPRISHASDYDNCLANQARASGIAGTAVDLNCGGLQGDPNNPGGATGAATTKAIVPSQVAPPSSGGGFFYRSLAVLLKIRNSFVNILQIIVAGFL